VSPVRRHSRASLVRSVVAVAVGAAILSPVASSAQEDPAEQQEEVRERQSEIELEIDLLEARDAEIEQALADIQANVETQQAELAEAERAAEAAEEDLAEAEQAVIEGQQRIDDLDQATDDMVVDSFVNPPTASALEAFTADSISDAAVKQAILSLQSDSDADLLDQMEAARDDLELDKANKEDIAAEAAEKQEAAETELADLESALEQQQGFAAEVEARLERRLSEAESLRRVDAELSRRIEEQQAALARQLQAAQAAQAAAGIEPPPAPESSVEAVPGGLANVTCPTGGIITVAGSIAGNVQGLLDLAGQQGVPLCGWGYRNPEEQIQLRMEHCGTTDYAIYQMPASQCSPPTARPGASQHEVGLAIDFTCDGGSIVAGGSCDTFLKANAASYGLYNLPSEIWHYSTTGN
jgi:peptidoglycan hydrolase CwlO-like protein